MLDNGTVITDQGYTWHCWLFGEGGVVRVSPEALVSHRHDIYRHAQHAFGNFSASFTESYRFGDVVIHRWKDQEGQDIVTIDTVHSENFRRGVRFLAEDGQNRIEVQKWL